MESEKKLNHENNNTSFPVQIERRRKLIKEVNNKYRQFTLATHNNTKEESDKARILTVERIEKIERIPKFNGLEWHHGHTSYDVDKTNHPQGESGCSFPH